MPNIEILESGLVDRGDAAFPTLVQLDDGDIVCGFSRGGGAHANGGTHCARSSDGGRTWAYQGVILDRSEDPVKTNHLRLSRTADGTILAYGQRDQLIPEAVGDRRHACEPLLCRSTDDGRSWSAPEVIPFQVPGPYEISNPIVVTAAGRWLAPAATLYEGRYGELVVVHESLDEGATWPNMHTVFKDQGTGTGYLEQKLIETEPGQVMALAWTQDFVNDTDLKNEYSFSKDGGHTWDSPYPTGIQGQTMTPIWLGGDRYLVLYNKRFGDQSIQMCLVRASGSSWTIEFEGMLFDGHGKLELTDEVSSQEQIGLIKFGYPMGMRLDDQTMLTVHWCEEDGVCGIRWTRLQVNW
ncbi:MAG: sialidase family protein [Lentisphaeria bacterium]|jgi:hypothetical protein|nr:sialidase family protein [Lentisphaeria bacterium]MDP7742745.1 sialidase family protein [Lentisphaeria bacterium]